MTAALDLPTAASLAGERPAPRGRRGAAALLVVVLVGAAWATLQLYGLDLSRFHTKGEPREAVVVQDLVQRGDWVLPRRNAEQLPRKPPLFYWLGAIAAHARGVVDEAAVRLPSALMSGAACLLLAAVTTVLYGSIAGIVSGLTLLTCFEWLRAATAARVDMTLAFGLTLSFVGLLCFRRAERRAWLILFYAGAAWATLSKGIPGLVIPVLQVILLCLLADRSLGLIRRLRPVVGISIVLLLAGSWYAAAAAQGGRAFVSIVVDENLVRVVGERQFALGHHHSFGYLIATLAGGLLPWTFLLPSLGLALWQARRSIDRSDARLFSLLWIAAVVAPYAVAASKRGVYLLPLYPAVCLLLGWWAAEVVRGRVAPRVLPRLLAPLGWVLGMLLVLLAGAAAAQAVGFGIVDAVAAYFDPRTRSDLASVAAAAPAAHLRLAVLLAIAAVGALALACGAGLRRWGIVVAAMILCTAAVTIGARAIVLPAIAAGQTRQPFAAALRRAVDDPASLSTVSSLDYGTLFYWGRPLPVYDPAGATPPPRYLILPEAAWLRMPAVQRRNFRRLPGLAIERGSNQGYAAVVQRTVDPAQRNPEP